MSEKDNKKKKINYYLREMDIDDIAKVFHLGEKLFTAQEVPNLYRTWDEYEVLNLFQADSEFCIVAVTEDNENIEDETIIGFVLGTTITKRHSAWKYGHLVWLGVDPVAQGQGVAIKLFNNFFDIMVENGVRMLLVDTEEDNVAAIKFFEKMGFGNPQEHVYMTMNLDAHRKMQKEQEENND